MSMLLALGQVLGCARSAPQAVPVERPESESNAYQNNQRLSAHGMAPGRYQVAVTWTTIDEPGPRSWDGELDVWRPSPASSVIDTELHGTLRLRCRSLEWVVLQDVVVTWDEQQLIIQGSNVREEVVSAGCKGYGWDVFRVHRVGAGWHSGAASGEHETIGDVTIVPMDAG